MICRLLTTYYKEPSRIRRAELDLCLALNRAAFDAVCVLSEGVPGDGWRVLDRRQTYDDALQWAAEVAEADDISIIANCDIVIPSKAVEQITTHIAANDVFCLSRYEVLRGGSLKLYDAAYSQDVWTFRGKPRVANPDFFGLPGCDNRFAHSLREAGYRVLNPSRSIKTIHVHNSRIRTATNAVKHRLQPPYLFVAPHHLGEEPTYRAVGHIDELREELIRCREIRREKQKEMCQQ